MEPKLEQAAKETAELIVNLTVQESIVAEKRKEVEAETVICKQKSDNASMIKADCDEAIKIVIPIKERAEKAVRDLKRDDIDMLRKVQKPTDGFKIVGHTMCVLFGIPPIKIWGATAKEGTTFDYWEPLQKKLLNPELIKKCEGFKKD